MVKIKLDSTFDDAAFVRNIIQEVHSAKGKAVFLYIKGLHERAYLKQYRHEFREILGQNRLVLTIEEYDNEVLILVAPEYSVHIKTMY